MWENPAPDTASQSPNQDQDSKPASEPTPMQRSHPPDSTVNQSSSTPRLANAPPCKAKRSFQQTKPAPAPDKEPQPGSRPTVKPRAPGPPATQPTTPNTQPQPAIRSQASLDSKAKQRKPTVKAPRGPPPPPPPQPPQPVNK
ncbi:hypothetical protein AGOR_G00227650 [Albula goreensis]|uniref:Uncharacterized protein n=1 Tax=Albula goreensis TaxID=1534307 RepID=A0A8T3CL62_9TELE|nr:hypothetical protein AGOR_G00227650 [Albula goreensis]